MTKVPAAAQLLDALEGFYSKYAIFPTVHHHTVLPLWAAHTHVYTEFGTTPRLFLDSPVPACGKTRTLELLDLTAADPLMAFSASPAALIRTIDAGGRSILFDEIDTLYNKGAGSGSEDVTAVVNAGYKQGATVPRCVGQGMDIQVVELSAFSPMALAGLHSNVPEAVRSRSIHFRMQKRKPSEKVSPFYRRDAEKEAEPLREALTYWLEPHRDALRSARPRMPKGVEDRPAEVWEPLLAIADLAGGEWPKRAREACTHFVFAKNGYARPIGVDLLADIQKVFNGAERMTSVDLVAGLLAIPDAGWSDVKGSFLTQLTLSSLLRPFDVRPKTIRVQGKTPKGYVVAGEGGLGEAWERHLRPEDSDDEGEEEDVVRAPVPPEAATPETPATVQVKTMKSVAAPVSGSATVSGAATPPETENSPSTCTVAGVAPVAGSQGTGARKAAKKWLLEQEESA